VPVPETESMERKEGRRGAGRRAVGGWRMGIAPRLSKSHTLDSRL
jgi:hypothetical protein